MACYFKNVQKFFKKKGNKLDKEKHEKNKEGILFKNFNFYFIIKGKIDAKRSHGWIRRAFKAEYI